MNSTAFLNTLAEATGSPADSLQLSTVLADLIGWDSMGKLELLAMVDEKFNVRLAEGGIAKAVTAQDLWTAVQAASNS